MIQAAGTAGVANAPKKPRSEVFMTASMQGDAKPTMDRLPAPGPYFRASLAPLQGGGEAVEFLSALRTRATQGPGGDQLGPTLGRLGSLEVRLATTPKGVRQAQRLRFKVFYEEQAAAGNIGSRLARRDIDGYDRICDHLLVFDHGPAGKTRIVGTYRLLRQDVAERHAGFYSADEYDLAPLTAAKPGLRFLELGRSCVLQSYRTARTVELLWHGIWTYVLHHRIDVMIGCASLPGTDPDRLAMPLSFLHHYASAPEPWRARALETHYVSMDRLPKDMIDIRAAFRELPPLIKGYVRLGARFGDGAVIDRAFGTTDVLVILPVSAINRRYIDHFGPAAQRHAA